RVQGVGVQPAQGGGTAAVGGHGGEDRGTGAERAAAAAPVGGGALGGAPVIASGPAYGFFVDPSRCIGCEACVNACAECESHRGHSMIHVDYVDRPHSIATVPTVCMHCENPTCAEVCPADAIKQDEDGVVHSSLKPRCVA